MSIFSASQLSGPDEAKVLDTARVKIEETADRGSIGVLDLRETLSLALKQCGFVRDTSRTGNRVNNLVAAIVTTLNVDAKFPGLGPWLSEASGVEVRAALEEAVKYRR